MSLTVRRFSGTIRCSSETALAWRTAMARLSWPIAGRAAPATQGRPDQAPTVADMVLTGRTAGLPWIVCGCVHAVAQRQVWTKKGAVLPRHTATRPENRCGGHQQEPWPSALIVSCSAFACRLLLSTFDSAPAPAPTTRVYSLE